MHTTITTYRFTTTEGIAAVADIEAMRQGVIGLVIREDRNDLTGWRAPLLMALPVAHVSLAILATVASPADADRLLSLSVPAAQL